MLKHHSATAVLLNSAGRAATAQQGLQGMGVFFSVEFCFLLSAKLQETEVDAASIPCFNRKELFCWTVPLK